MKAGWQLRKLGDVCRSVRGPFGGSLKKSVFVADGYAVYEQSHAIYEQFEEIRYFVEDDKFREMQRFEIHSNDLIMSCSGTMGKVAIVPEGIRRGIINQALLKLSPSSAISSHFLKYWMDRDPSRGRPAKIKVKLADGKARTIQHMMMTSFWHPDGTPMSAQQFLEMLFGKLPEFFQDEAELRALWSDPDTRARLLEGLAEKGFGRPQMAEMQKIIDAENSDLFDVLAHVAYALPPLTREERATRAKVAIGNRFTTKQQVFLGFVLSQYVKVGVEELDRGKLSPLLKLKYNNAISDAWADLGRPEEVGFIFAGFQKYLYQQAV